MKKFLSVMLSAVLVSFASCTNDNLSGGEADGAEDGGDFVFVDVAVSRPSTAGTRSSTDWEDENNKGNGETNSDEVPDYEYGYDYENAVHSVLLVIATNEDKFIAYSTTLVNDIDQPDPGKQEEKFEIEVTTKFKKSTIDAAYTNLLKTNQTVRLYAYCNYPAALAERFSTLTPNDGSTDWLHWEGSLDETAGSTPAQAIWGKDAFLMTNAKIKTATFPASAEAWAPYTKEENPFDLSGENGGPIYVERTTARIDFRDASDGDFTYHLTANSNAFIDETTAPTTAPNLLDVQFTKMSLVNMSKGFYYLRRVSNNGKKDDNYTGGLYPNNLWRIGANETKTNYVVDTDYAIKVLNSTNGGYTPATAVDGFNFPLYSTTLATDRKKNDVNAIYNYNISGWYTTLLSSLEDGDNDTWTGQPNGGQYTIWRYVTENTIPQGIEGNDDTQKTVQSVGIVFKGKITAGTNVDAKTAVEADDNQYTAGVSYVSEALQEVLSDDITQNSPVLYYVNGLYYAGFDDMVKCAVEYGAGSTLDIIASSILGHWYLVLEEEPGDSTESKVEVSGKFEYEPGEEKTEGNTVIQLTPAIYNEIKAQEHNEENGLCFKDCTFDEKLAQGNDVFKALAVAQNITMYEPENDENTGWGYYCYYFYWNRHNDNKDNGNMGNMEFATVRNNVYKLAVTKLSRLGHPENPDDDPDPNTPDDPDEEENVYMKVEIQVLPWVVRVNDIEF